MDFLEFSMSSRLKFSQLDASDLTDSPRGEDEVLVPEAADRRTAVLHLVKANPDGTTAPDIARALKTSAPTALRALRELEREREVYSRMLRRIQIWYPNGRLIHPYLELFKEIRGKTYRLTVQEGRAGPSVQIQEQSFSLLHGKHVDGAIFVDYAAVEDLLSAIKELTNRYEATSGRMGERPK